MNPQNWIAIAAIAVTILLAVLLALSKYATRQRENAVDTAIESLKGQVKAVNDRVSTVEGKFEAKLDAILVGQNGIQKDLMDLRARLEFERGSQCGIDAQVKALGESLVTREVFDVRMTAVDREIRDIKSTLSDLQKRRG